jgi:DeoR/GlpR family transcriptional regulator of sugar metabolism
VARVKTDISREERQERILSDVRAGAIVRVLDLATRFGVSTETVRRDLDQLSRNGLIDRTYGGGAPSLAAEPGLAERHRRLGAERRRIATTAAATVRPGEVLFLDAGSTTLHFAEALVARDVPLVVVTNALAVAECLGRSSYIKVRVCPGDLNAPQGAMVGPDTHAFLSRLNADCVAFGASGLTSAGPTEAESELAWVKRMMIERSERALLLVDHTKFDVRMLEIVCPLTDLDEVVTDVTPPDDLTAALRGAGVTITIA